MVEALTADPLHLVTITSNRQPFKMEGMSPSILVFLQEKDHARQTTQTAKI